MKKTGKFLAVILSVSMVGGVCALTACGGGDKTHTHTWGTEWQSDATGHWHVCTEDGEKSKAEAHVYDNDADADCNVCGYTRTVSTTPTIKAPTKDVSVWQDYTAEQYVAEDVSGKALSYQFTGSVAVEGMDGTNYLCINLYEDGLVNVLQANGNVFKYFGYWTNMDDSVYFCVAHYKVYGDAKTYTIDYSYNLTLSDNAFGAFEFNMTLGLQDGGQYIRICPVSGDGGTAYATEETFINYAAQQNGVTLPTTDKPAETPSTGNAFNYDPAGFVFTGSAYDGYLVQTVTLAADGAATVETKMGGTVNDQASGAATWSLSEDKILSVTFGDATKTVEYDEENNVFTLDFGSGAIMTAEVPAADPAESAEGYTFGVNPVGMVFTGSAYDGYLVQTVTLAADGVATVETKMGGTVNDSASGAATWTINSKGVLAVVFGETAAGVDFDNETNKYTLDFGAGAILTADVPSADYAGEWATASDYTAATASMTCAEDGSLSGSFDIGYQFTFSGTWSVAADGRLKLTLTGGSSMFPDGDYYGEYDAAAGNYVFNISLQGGQLVIPLYKTAAQA